MEKIRDGKGDGSTSREALDATDNDRSLLRGLLLLGDDLCASHE